MTNEQREAVEICKEKIIEPFYNFPNPISIELKDTDVGAKDIDTVLSLIKENQIEIEKYKALYDRALSDVVKADKQIDLMANCILAREIGKKTCQFDKKCTKYENGRDIHCKDCIKQYFERKVEDVKD